LTGFVKHAATAPSHYLLDRQSADPSIAGGRHCHFTTVLKRVELLRDHGHTMTLEEREHFLVNLGEDAERLERLVHRLLKLARADAAKPGQENNDLINVISQVAQRYQAEGFPVTIKSASHSIVIRAAPDLLESVFINRIGQLAEFF
jgi:signal transduction histidine kinase